LLARTLVLGAGFGGLTVATELREQLGEEHEVVLVDRSERFVMGLRKLWELVGHATISDGTRAREALNARGIRFLQRDIRAIDREARSAETDGETIEADYLVVALGAEPRPDLVAGLAQHAHDVWDVAGVAAAADALARFDGGRIAIVIAGVPYTCPPAPYECAMLLDEQLRARGLRERTELVVSTVQPMLLPNAGKEGSAWIAEQLSARGISFQVDGKVDRVEPGRVVFAGAELEFDLLIAVPPHRPPTVVKEWIAVDPATLETGQPGVFAIGDVTQITLANGLPLPKAGVIADAEGRRVAAAIAARVRGSDSPPPFDGRGYCFVEVGASSAALVEGDFFAEPAPRVAVTDASTAHAEAKRRFEAERLHRWFG
jgi:sulfide:quinone oxidoreductase